MTIVYKRKLSKEDFSDILNTELIYYKDNNIAYIIVKKDNNYIIRKKKIFNNQLVSERIIKTQEQLIKIINKEV